MVGDARFACYFMGLRHLSTVGRSIMLGHMTKCGGRTWPVLVDIPPSAMPLHSCADAGHVSTPHRSPTARRSIACRRVSTSTPPPWNNSFVPADDVPLGGARRGLTFSQVPLS